MARENFLGVNYHVDDKGFASRNPSRDASRSPVADVRRSIMEDRAERDVELSNIKFQQYLNSNGKFDEANQARGVDIEGLKHNGRVLTNEATFALGSLAEGFLSFYGVQVDKSLEKYENKLHVLENEETGSYIGKINEKGEVHRVSPFFASKELAQEKLKEFEKSREVKRNQDAKAEVQLNRNRGEGN